jgi:hypothetical protein
MTVSPRLRPLGVAPGTLALVAAWIVAGMIARLTGTPVVIALMAALVVAVATDALAGAALLRRLGVAAITTPPTSTTGMATTMRVDLDHPGAGGRAGGRTGRVRLVDVATGTLLGAGFPTAEGGRDGLLITVRFDQPGIVRALSVQIDLPGPFGLVWWRRTAVCEIEPIHVAPPAGESTVERTRVGDNARRRRPERTRHPPRRRRRGPTLARRRPRRGDPLDLVAARRRADRPRPRGHDRRTLGHRPRRPRRSVERPHPHCRAGAAIDRRRPPARPRDPGDPPRSTPSGPDR